MTTCRRPHLLVLLLALGLMSGCELFGGAPVKTSDQNVQVIDLRQLKELLASKEAARTVLVDARPARHYAAGHIPGALNLGSLAITDPSRADPLLAQAKTIITYGRDWDDAYVRPATKKFIQLGYRNVLEFSAGLRTWQGEGNAIEPPATQPTVR